MRTKIKPPQQTTVLDRDVLVLRKLNMKKIPAGIYDILAETNLEPGVREEQMVWFEEGYVANDQPRDGIVSKILIGATKGFAIARTDTGEILAEYAKDDLVAADRAAANAKVRLDFDVSLEEDSDENVDDDNE